MFNLFSPKQQRVFITLALVLILFFAITLFITSRPTPPTITQTNPTDYATKVSLYDNLKITYNKPLSSSEIIYSLTPKTTLSVSEEKNSHILAPAQPLQPSTEYRLQITWNGQELKPLIFTTAASQTDPILIENIKTELERDYPLGQKLPLNKPGFRVVYSSPLTLEITLKNEGAERDEVINAVRDWVKENGLDPDGHTYTISN